MVINNDEFLEAASCKIINDDDNEVLNSKTSEAIKKWKSQFKIRFMINRVYFY